MHRPLVTEALQTAPTDPHLHAAVCKHCRISLHRAGSNATVALKLDPLAYGGRGGHLEVELARLLSATGKLLSGTAPMGAGARRLRQALGPNWSYAPEGTNETS